MWQPRGVHFRRGSRALLAVLAVPLAAAGLAGCRTSPSVAAYVGDGQITVDRLQAAEHLRTAADPAVAAYAKAHPTEFSRFVLETLIDRRVYAAAAAKYHVQVSDDAVRQRLGELIAAQGTDATTVARQAAAQGVTSQDLLAQVRDLVIAERAAAASGASDALGEDALRQRYAQERDSLAQTQIGYIAVADQATADAVLRQLTANPSGYPAVAAAHPSSVTLPRLRALSAKQIPQQIASQVAAARPGTGFTVPDAQLGVVVVFVGRQVVPTFEQARATLVQEAESSLDQAGSKLVADVRSGLHVSVNPRYGVLKDGRLQTPTGGVVTIPTAGSGAGTGGQ
jgi:peptidyl-prolyl cis-trans isomerase SurA